MDVSPRPLQAALLERESECEQLDRSIERAAAGEGSVVAIEGPAGIGKTELMRFARRRAREAGMRVLSARGGELEQDFGYGVVRQLLEAPLTAMAPAQRARVLDGAAAHGASALALPGEGDGDGASDPGSVLHGLHWLSANLCAEQPLLLAVDDAHWADGASIAFFSYLARRVEGLALLVVYATRSGDGASADLPAAAEPGLVGGVLRPSLLSEQATIELVGRLLGSDGCPEFARACRVATAGNPFLLQELLRTLRYDGIAPELESCQRVAQIAPGTISRATLARLRRLGDAATQLAFATAVLGKSAELRHAAGVAQLAPDAAGAAADALTAAGILRDGRPLEFIHPIVRTTVYAEIPAAQRAASHRRAARLLEQEGAAPSSLAPHLIASEPAGDEAVVRLLRAAAAEVSERGAIEAACTYLQRALAEPPRAQERASILYELGAAELSMGRPESLGRLSEALEGEHEPWVQLDAATSFVIAVALHGRIEEGLAVLDASIDRLAELGDVEAAMQLEGMFVCTAQLDPATSRRARARLERHEGRLRGDTIGERMLLAGAAFDTAHRPVPAARAAALADLALAGGSLLYDQYRHARHAANFPLATWVLVYADELERAAELYTLAVEFGRARGSLIAFAIATGCLCQVRFRQGHLAEAEAEARSCLEAAGHAWIIGRPMLIGCVIDAMLERADGAACEAFLAEHDIGEDLAGAAMASRLLYSRGHLRLATGDAAGALRDFEQIRARDRRSGMETAAVPTRACSALALAQLGEHVRARELAAEQLAIARVWNTPSALSFALRASGVVIGGDEGLELLRQAAAAVEHSPARYERALSLTEYGAALRRAGRRRDARLPLREALELADRCGATRTAQRAREELLASGARPRRIALRGADALTPSERRVCRLAADGLSNREIAQALFVTVRTVEGHLTQAYMKLDIGSREQLAAALESASVEAA